MPHLAADPYAWLWNSDWSVQNTALITIDMQTDFCCHVGYVEKMGYDLTLTRAPIAPIQGVLSAMRSKGYCIIHTRERHRPDLSDLPPNKRRRSRQMGAGIGDVGPCGKILIRRESGWNIIGKLTPPDCGEAHLRGNRSGWNIIGKLTPLPREIILDKPGKGSFYATDLELILRTRGISDLILTGITTDVCVCTTVRDANDRGFECLVLEDCCAATDLGNHLAALKMIKMQGGVFGAVGASAGLLEALP